MAVLEILNKAGKYHDLACYEDVIKYCISRHKAISGYTAGRSVHIEQAAQEMKWLAAAYGKQGTRLRHMVLSFAPNELNDANMAFRLGWNIMGFYSGRYQIILAVHENKEHLHIHFVMNTVCYLDGKKYKGDKKDFYDFRRYVKELLSNYGLHLRN